MKLSFWERIKNNPVLLSGFLIAGINLFILDPEQASKWSTFVTTGIPLVLAFIVREQVTGPVTSKKIAKAVTDPPASREAVQAAEKVLE